MVNASPKLLSRIRYGATGISVFAFVAAADATFGTKTSNWLLDICLTGEVPGPMPEGLPMDMEDHTWHAMSFILTGLAAAVVPLGIDAFCPDDRPGDKSVRRILAAIHLVAGPLHATQIERVFQAATGHPLGDGVALKAARFFARKTLSAEQVFHAQLSRADRRRIVRAAVYAWEFTGVDCARTTRNLEDVLKALKAEAREVERHLGGGIGSEDVIELLNDWAEHFFNGIAPQRTIAHA